MSRDICEREADVLASSGGPMSDTLQAHLEHCASCREVATLTGAMRAALDEEERLPLPDAGRLWWRAEIEARREARARSMRPLDTVERAEPFIALAAAALLFVLRGDYLLGALARLVPGDASMAALQIALPGPVLVALVTGVVLSGLMLLVGLGAAFARD